jgi:hypothetical protein
MRVYLQVGSLNGNNKNTNGTPLIRERFSQRKANSPQFGVQFRYYGVEYSKQIRG